MKKLLIIIFLVLGIVIFFRACNDGTEEARSKAQKAATDYVDAGTIKARQTEAQMLLRNLYQKEQKFYAEHGYYTSHADSLQAFRKSYLENGQYYKLEIITATDTKFLARASGNVDHDVTIDIWEVDEGGKIINTDDDLVY